MSWNVFEKSGFFLIDNQIVIFNGTLYHPTRYIPNPEFNPNIVRHVSAACEGLCRWVRAMEVYDRVIKIVSPKRAKLQEAEQELARQMKRLSEKHSQLQQVKQSNTNYNFLRLISLWRWQPPNRFLCNTCFPFFLDIWQTPRVKRRFRSNV